MKHLMKFAGYTVIGLSTVAMTSIATAGEGCPSKRGMSAQKSAEYLTTASYQYKADLGAGGFIKTGHHMENEKHDSKNHGGSIKSNVDIVDTAVATGTFNTLVTAVKAAGLVDTLKGDGPFTVFAPTDEAFAKLPKAKLDALLQDKEGLRKILTYHVVAGKVSSDDVIKLKSAKTVEGQSIRIDSQDGVKINNANVIMTDIMTTNGIIHVVDTVILPPDMMASL